MRASYGCQKVMKKPFGDAYKVGDEVVLSELEGREGAKEYRFIVVEVTKDLIIIEDENGRTATLKQPSDIH